MGGLTELPGDISSQYVSALLLVAPLAEKNSTIRLTTPLESRSYVLMTLECLEQFGIQIKHSENLMEFEISPQKYQPAMYQVEGDWSSASYLLGLGAVTGDIGIENLNLKSLQGDKVHSGYFGTDGCKSCNVREHHYCKKKSVKLRLKRT